MKKQHIELISSDRSYLLNLLSKGTLNVRVQRRARGLLELDKGKTYQEVADMFEMSYPAVHSWGKKYRTEGLNFLKDKPRSGRPAGLSAEQRAKITAVACSEAPKGYARWSLRLLADRLVELEIVESISHTDVGRVLKKMNYSLIEKDNGASEK